MCLCCIKAQGRGDVHGQLCDTALLVSQRPQLFLEGHAVQLFGAAGQRLFAVLRPEKRCVFQARADHPFIAGLYLFRVMAGNVGNGNEVWQQLIVRAGYRKKFLVILHAGDQCLGRYLKEAGFKVAGNRDRPLDQCSDFIQQIFIDSCVAAKQCAGLGNLRADRVSAPLHIGYHMAGVFQQLDVVCRVKYGKAFIMVKPVSTCVAVGRQAKNLCRQWCIAQQ